MQALSPASGFAPYGSPCALLSRSPAPNSCNHCYLCRHYRCICCCCCAGTEEHRLRHAAAVGGGNTRMDHAVHLSTAESESAPLPQCSDRSTSHYNKLCVLLLLLLCVLHMRVHFACHSPGTGQQHTQQLSAACHAACINSPCTAWMQCGATEPSARCTFSLTHPAGTEEHRSRSAAIFEPSPVHPGGLGSTTHMTPSTGLGPGQHITLAEPGLVAPTAGTTLTSGSARGLDQDSLEPGEGPGYNSKTGGLAPMDAGTHPHNSWAGTRDVHPGRGTSGAVGMGGYTAEGKETVGHKIKKAIPGG